MWEKDRTKRTNRTEKIKIEEKAFKCRLSVSEYMRNAALNEEIKEAINVEDLQKIKALFNVANNLNQITKKMHQKGLVNSAAEVDYIINKIKKIVD